MARTAQAQTLTEQHRLAQLQIRAQAVSDYTRLWPMWQDDDEESFLQMLASAYVLVKGYNAMSSALAGVYYRTFRQLENVIGDATQRLAPAPYEGEVIGTMRLTGQRMYRKALRSGQTREEARRNALVRTSGDVTRFTLAGGRDTIIDSVRADKQATGWVRVTDADPCAFCLTLASRGAVYSEDTVGFRAHGHCGCTAAPVFRGDPLTRSKEQLAIYNAAIDQAKAAGEFQRGTENDAINAVRRYLDRQHASSAH